MYIYCYTNKVNGKKYIGQTNNPERRKREHKSKAFNKKDKDYDVPFYRAIRKYGLENFSFEILSETNNPNEEEKRFISELNSLSSKNGYNVQIGGQDSNGEFLKALSEEEVNSLRLELKGDKDTNYLCEKYGISQTLLSNINQGLRYFSKEETYPIRKRFKDDSEYSELIFLLKETDLSFAEVAKKLNIGVSTVKKINYGKMRKGLYPNYPIRPYKRKPVSTIPKA